MIVITPEIYATFDHDERKEWGTFLKRYRTPHWLVEVRIDIIAEKITFISTAHEATTEPITHGFPVFLTRYDPTCQLWQLQSPPAPDPRQPNTRRPQEVIFNMGTNTVRDSDPPGTIATQFLDAAGAPGPPDDIPQWASSDETRVSVSSVTADGTAATVAYGVPSALDANGAPVPTKVVITSTDKNGTSLQGEEDFIVEAGEPVSIVTTFTPGT